DAAIVDVNALLREPVDRFADRRIARADRDDAPAVARRVLANHCPGNELGRRAPLAEQPVDDLLILACILGVAAVLVVPGAAHEIGAPRVHAGVRAIGDAVAVLVEIAMEALGLLELV